jgi:hypothetical protein
MESTWYKVVRDYSTSGWKAESLKVVHQTAKSITVRETWEATQWMKAGSRDRRVILTEDYYDSLESANAEIHRRLENAVRNARNAFERAKDNLEIWKTEHA